MAKIADKNKTKSNVYSIKAYKNKANKDVLIPYLALLVSLIALAKSFKIF